MIYKINKIFLTGNKNRRVHLKMQFAYKNKNHEPKSRPLDPMCVHIYVEPITFYAMHTIYIYRSGFDLEIFYFKYQKQYFNLTKLKNI